MNRHSYSLLLLLLTPFLLLYLAFRASKNSAYRQRVVERFGFGLPAIKHPLVVHCASMGETLAALPLIQALKQRYPNAPILVTTSTPTGSEQVKKHLGNSVSHCYLPLDLSFTSRRFIAQLEPKAVVLLETELWPNLIHHCHQRQIPVILANGRLSQRSAEKYAKWPKLVQPMLAQLSAAAVQTQSDGNRLITLGLAQHSMHLCGSLKFDLDVDETARQHAQQLGQHLWQTRPSWIAASVHPAEFASILAAHQRLLQTHPHLLLLLVPRHPEQFNLAIQQTKAAGFHYQCRSEQQPITAQTQVLIGDSMGELKMLYGACDLAFVGGSLIERGGHNPLEPAAFGKPILMGPHDFNFAQIGDLLKQQQVLFTVEDHHTLSEKISELLTDLSQRSAIAARALALVQQNQGATEQQLAVISALLDNRS